MGTKQDDAATLADQTEDLTDEEAIRQTMGEDVTLPDDETDDPSEAGAADGGLDTESPVYDDGGLDDPATPPPAEVDLGAVMQEMGLDKKYETPEAVIRAYAEAQKVLSARDELAAIGRQVLPHQQEFAEFMQQRQQQPPPSAWAPPHAYDDRMRRLEMVYEMARRAEQQGLDLPHEWHALSDADRQAVSEYVDYRSSTWASILNNPEERLAELVLPRVESRIQQAFDYQRDVQRANDFMERYKDLVQDPATHQQIVALNEQEQIPFEAAAIMVRQSQEIARLRSAAGEVEKDKQSVSKKKEQLRRQNGRRANQGGRPQKSIDPRGKTDNELIEHVLALDAAGELDD